jgi:RimJ/RimL family protein N-acetyltransferase
MAGIKMLEKKAEHLNYVINCLLKPEIRQVMLDDMIGMGELSLWLFDPFTIVYGIFEKGHPVPIGCVILSDVRPFRGAEVHGVIFKPENRNAKKMQGIAEMVKYDMMTKWFLHYASARVVSTNAASKHLVEKLGMTKVGTKPGNIVVGGEYADVDEYYVVLGGEKLLEVPIPK